MRYAHGEIFRNHVHDYEKHVVALTQMPQMTGRTLGEHGSAGRDGCGKSPWLGPGCDSAGSDA